MHESTVQTATATADLKTQWAASAAELHAARVVIGEMSDAETTAFIENYDKAGSERQYAAHVATAELFRSAFAEDIEAARPSWATRVMISHLGDEPLAYMGTRGLVEIFQDATVSDGTVVLGDIQCYLAERDGPMTAADMRRLAAELLTTVECIMPTEAVTE